MDSILNKLSDIALELVSTTKRNEKIAILEKYKADDDFKRFLYFLYNPYITTGISNAKFNKALSMMSVNTIYDSLFSILDYVKIHNTGTDEVLKNVCAYVLNQDERDLLRGIFTKNYQLGIDTKTINSVFGKDFIPTFEVQLANSYQKRKDKLKGRSISITKKIDGVRCFVVKNDRDVHFYNRSGIEITDLIELLPTIQELKAPDILGDSYCIDGELYAIGDFKESKDGYKATIERSRIKGNKTGLKLRAFDFLLPDEYKNKIGTEEYHERRAFLEMIGELNNSPFFEVLPTLYVGEMDEEIIDKIAHEQIEKGEEGVMINDLNACYQFKRSDVLMKYKLFDDYDLTVTGFEEGEGKNKGTLGAILVDYKGFLVKVGSGFSDELRNEIWNNKEEWLGRTIIVKAFESTSNQQGGESLRFPVYVDWRDDK